MDDRLRVLSIMARTVWRQLVIMLSFPWSIVRLLLFHEAGCSAPTSALLHYFSYALTKNTQLKQLQQERFIVAPSLSVQSIIAWKSEQQGHIACIVRKKSGEC